MRLQRLRRLPCLPSQKNTPSSSPSYKSPSTHAHAPRPPAHPPAHPPACPRSTHLHQAFHLADPEASSGVVTGHQEVFLLDADRLASERGVQDLFYLAAEGTGREIGEVWSCYRTVLASPTTPCVPHYAVTVPALARRNSAKSGPPPLCLLGARRKGVRDATGRAGAAW